MSSIKCAYCGHVTGNSVKFCPECGKPMRLNDAPPVTVKSALNDHVIVVAILVVAAMIFTGYHLLKPEGAAQGGMMGNGRTSAMGEMDIDAFARELPEDFDALTRMGHAMMDNGQYQMAEICYGKALTIDSSVSDILVDMATCQHALGQNEKAITSFTRALQQQPDHKIAKFNLGIVYYTLGQDDKAREWWQKLLSENPPEELKLRTKELMQKLPGI